MGTLGECVARVDELPVFLSQFIDAFSFPSGVLGPVDFLAFLLFAFFFRGVTMRDSF